MRFRAQGGVKFRAWGLEYGQYEVQSAGWHGV